MMDQAVDRPVAVQASKLQRLLLPSVTDIVFVILAIAAPISKSHDMLNSDGDLARHLRVGNAILDTHRLFYHDIFSFTVLGKPFVPYEWLSEVTYALTNRLGGLLAVAILTGLIVALTYALVTHFLRARGVDPLLAFTTGIFAAIVSELHWLARPHIFSPLATIALVILLERERERWRDFVLYAGLFALWTNVHGGFLFGLILIALYLAGDLAEFRFGDRSRQWLARARQHGMALLVSLIACCVNPSGPALFKHVTGYLGETYLVNNTMEYRSPNFHELGPRIFLVALLLIVAGLALQAKRPTFPRLLTLLVTVAFALVSARNIPLFTVSALPLMALELAPLWQRTHGKLARLQESFSLGDRVATGGVWAGIMVLLMAMLAMNHGMAAGTPIVTAEFDPAFFPVAAVADAREAKLTGRIFNQLSWGGYLLTAWPEQKVFIDGQTDLYGEAVTRDFVDISTLEPGWRTLLNHWDIALVIMPSDSPLANELARAPDWGVWHCDATATILQRGGAERPAGITPDCPLLP